jgi:chromosomal replication initiator protein
MYLTRQLTPLSLAEIARRFNRDHSTVLHAIRRVGGELEPGSETAQAIHLIHTKLGTRETDSPSSSTDDSDNPPTTPT